MEHAAIMATSQGFTTSMLVLGFVVLGFVVLADGVVACSADAAAKTSRPMNNRRGRSPSASRAAVVLERAP